VKAADSRSWRCCARTIAKLVLAAICLSVLCAGFLAGTAPGGLLLFGVALVLGIALLARLARRYSGERVLVRLARRAAQGPCRPPKLAHGARGDLAALIARGGSLMGRSLAVRPPPAVLRSPRQASGHLAAGDFLAGLLRSC
jgi:hypothetical protein